MRRRVAARGLLASAIVLTGLMAGAAELPTMRAAPPKHARSCRVDGMDGYYLAGSAVCVRVSGYISGGVEMGKGWSK
jgi:hypothetical protein